MSHPSTPHSPGAPESADLFVLPEFAIDTPARLAIIGAGPAGLEAALYARFLGYDIAVFDRGRVVERLRSRRHLPTLQPFRSLCSPLGIQALEAQHDGFQTPVADSSPTIGEWLDRYLLPLAATDLLADHIRENTEVLAVGRAGFLRGEMADDPDRGDYSFRVLFRASEERALEGRASEEHERIEEFDGVIDASGLDMPRFLGESGIPAIGELAARRCDKLPWRNVPPDLAGIDLETFRQQRIVIVGETLDAALSLRSACELSERFPQTRVTWITRRLVDVVDVDSPGPIEEPTGDFGDAVLQLIRDTNALARSPNRVQLLSGTAIHAMRAMERESNAAPWRLELIGKHAGTLECDWLLGHVGFRVDERITSELHVRRCPARDRVLGDALDIAMNPSRHRVSASDGVIAEPHYHVIGNKRAGKPLGVTFAQCLEQIQRLFAILGDRPSLNLYANRKPNRDG